MRVCAVNYNLFKMPVSNNKEKHVSSPFLRPLACDTVSFSGKSYDSTSIESPTGHCAYCGSKVYTKQQIDSICKEMLNLKNDKLGGKIRSMLEKLDSKSVMTALAIKKSEINKENIEFFKRFEEYCIKHNKMSGAEILKELYGYNQEESLQALSLNLSPLLKTIDHVIPQRRELENDNSDINLVEACYTCNSKIKNGDSFQSFLLTYPSIKDHMPKDKFEYASVGILEQSPDIVVAGLEVSELLKIIDGLFLQKSAVQTELYSVDERIKSCVDGINKTIVKIEGEKKVKQQEIDDLRQQHESHMHDFEFSILLKRKNLTTELNNLNQQRSDLRDNFSKMNRSYEYWQSKLVEKSIGIDNKQHEKRDKSQLSTNEIQDKIQSAQSDKTTLNIQIDAVSLQIAEKENELSALNFQCPDANTLRADKSKLEELLVSYSQLRVVNVKIDEIKEKIAEAEAKQMKLSDELKSLPQVKNCDSSCSESEKEEFDKYNELSNQLSYIDATGATGVQKIININAKARIQEQIAELLNNRLVQNAQNEQKRKSITSAQASNANNIKSLESAKKELNVQQDHLCAILADYINKYAEVVEGSELPTNQDVDNLIESAGINLSEISAQIMELEEEKQTLEIEIVSFPEVDLPYSEMSEEQKTEFANYKRLLEDLEYTKSSINNGLSPKVVKSELVKIEELECEIESMCSNPFIKIAENGRNRTIRKSRHSEVLNRLEFLTTQKNSLENKYPNKDNIVKSFNPDEVKDKILDIQTLIKRLNDKTLWLDIPINIKKNEAELKIQEQNIQALRQKLGSINKEN